MRDAGGCYMKRICVDPANAARDEYDLIVVGGGLCGACMALEAAQRGLRPLLLEAEDFGGGATANSLRVIDGGLRHLRRMDISGCLESARERAWFLQHFPDLVRPLPCLMPLDGRSYRRPGVLRRAMAFYEQVTRGINERREVPRARIIESCELARLARASAMQYQAAALWHEAVIDQPQRLIMELLRWAVASDAVCINYMQAEELVQQSRRVGGVLARDRRSGLLFEYRAGAVINCAGPCSRSLAAEWDRDCPWIFHPSVAFSVWFDVDPPCADHALVVPPRKLGGRPILLVPQSRGVLAGTQHLAWSGDMTGPVVTEDQLFSFISFLNNAVPGLKARLDNVERVYARLMPARRSGSVREASRPVICDHGAIGGPAGFYSISGVSYTSARPTAQRALDRLYGARPHQPGVPRPEPTDIPAAEDLVRSLPPAHELKDALQKLIEAESVVHLDDLILRRTDWAEHPELLEQVIGVVWGTCKWDESRRIAERARLAIAMRQSGSPWPSFPHESRSSGTIRTRGNAAL